MKAIVFSDKRRTSADTEARTQRGRGPYESAYGWHLQHGFGDYKRIHGVSWNLRPQVCWGDCGMQSEGVDREKKDNTFDVVIDASGSVSGFVLALSLLKPRGIFILKSTIYDAIQINTAKFVVDEIHLIGSRCGQFEPAVRLLEKGLIQVKPLISFVFPFGEWKKAFQKTQNPETLKVLLSMK